MPHVPAAGSIASGKLNSVKAAEDCRSPGRFANFAGFWSAPVLCRFRSACRGPAIFPFRIAAFEFTLKHATRIRAAALQGGGGFANRLRARVEPATARGRDC